MLIDVSATDIIQYMKIETFYQVAGNLSLSY